MARKQNELMERTTGLQKNVDEAKAEAEAKQSELDRIQAASTSTRNKQDDLIEAQRVTSAESARTPGRRASVAALKDASCWRPQRLCVNLIGRNTASRRLKTLGANDAQPLQ